MQHVIFATINKTRQSPSSTTKAAHAGACCGSSSTQTSCCQTSSADQQSSCCSTTPSNGCCNPSNDQPQPPSCSRSDIAPPTGPTAPSTIESTHQDTATTQLSALKISQQPESLRSIVFPEGVAMQDCTIFYVGEETRGLVNLMMEHAENRVSSGAPDSCRGVTVLMFFACCVDIRILTRRYIRLPAPHQIPTPPLPPPLRTPLLIQRINIRNPRPQRRPRPFTRARQTPPSIAQRKGEKELHRFRRAC